MPKRRTEPADPAALPDAEARRAIREDLGTTILVEAAAGTGKTSSLVERMVRLVATGSTTVDRLSAVTFTVRAAAQLRQRFQNALEEALRKDRGAAECRLLEQALSGIDSCFLGTIHAFAARLLRERPVEAGVIPGFEEMDEPEDGAARREAWDRFGESLFLREDPRLARLLELGVALKDLWDAFEVLCENSDVRAEAAPGGGEPDFFRARAQTAAFLTRAFAALPSEVPRGGWPPFPLAIRRARRLAEVLDSSRAADFVRILKVLRPKGLASSAHALRKEFERFREETIKPALTSWAESIHPDVFAVLVEARRQYALWRRREGRLNFQDLLLLARDLLRDHPRVRSALRQRFTPILVDEFQDTDPIQAEILFYLTGEDTDEKQWRKLTPRPGSLFVVADPKQSIYRFRRADIETYEIVRDSIAGCGRLLQLSTNFRSSPALCDWVNGAFGRLFPKSPGPEQAAYVPLSPGRPEEAEGPAVFRLETPASGNADQPVVNAEAARIAAFIEAAVGNGEWRPEEFLLLFRRRKFMADYARALEERGIPCEIAGGEAFGGSEELENLLPLLRALADPDDPVPLLAALRGPIFGVDDEALYRFARAGGRFDLRSQPPEDADPGIRRAFERLRKAAALVETLPPAAAISRLAGRLGWTANAAARELGDSRAGNLLKALAAARGLSSEGRDFPAVVGELERLREENFIEQMGLEPGRPGAVRLMTLHGAKGLEAPVVFLADPTRDSGRPRSYCIDRGVEPPVGHFRVTKRAGDYGEEEIARPYGWERMQQTEERFDDAERIRLLYVGATRAREMLVVGIKRTTSGEASGPWARLDASLTVSLPEPAASPRPPAARPVTGLEREIAAFRSRRVERLERCGRPSYAVLAVTALAHAIAAPPARERTGRGMQWGRIIHGLLEASMRDPAVDLGAYARNLFAEEERSPEDIEEALRLAAGVRASALWQRALAAKRHLVEVPFALLCPSRDLGLAGEPVETLLQGAIDLVFEEEDGWTLIDYKSDAVPGGDLAPLLSYYAPQVGHYRRYWKRLTGRPTRAGLFFVETGQLAWLEESGSSE